MSLRFLLLVTLAKLSDRSAFDRLRIDRIVDFRGATESTPDPDLRPAVHDALPIFDEAHANEDLGHELVAKLTALASATDSAAQTAARADIDEWGLSLHERMIHAYEALVLDDTSRRQFAALVSRVALGKRIVFHCVSGKDRTGIAAALILRGVGVPWAEVMRDYLLSNDELAEQNQATIAGALAVWGPMENHPDARDLSTVLGVQREYLEAAFQRIEDELGHGELTPDVASDEAIAAFYAAVFGPGSQDALKAALLEP